MVHLGAIIVDQSVVHLVVQSLVDQLAGCLVVQSQWTIQRVRQRVKVGGPVGGPSSGPKGDTKDSVGPS